MTTLPPNPPPTAEQLRQQCHAIIERLYRHRLNAKLLASALRGLEIVAGYKANRTPTEKRQKAHQ